MKHLKLPLSATALLLFFLISFAQAQNEFKYQAVIRDVENNILQNQSVGIRVVIQQGTIGGTAVYSETFTTTTNALGVLNLDIGSGATNDDFSDIDWTGRPLFLETAIDVTGGTSYEVISTSQFLKTPGNITSKKRENIEDTLDALPHAIITEIAANEGNIGIGISNPLHPLSVLQETGTTNTVRIQSLEHVSGKDLLELVVPAGTSAGGQFIEMQNGSSVVAKINTDGSAKFKSVQFEDNSIQITAANGPIAFGSISTSGNINSGTANYSVTWIAAGNRYEVAITGAFYHVSNYTTIVTPAHSSVRAVRTSSTGGKLLVYLYNSAGNNIQGNFHFVTYK